MKIIRGNFCFESTGRSFDANRNLVSINDELEIAQGYDGSISVIPMQDEEYIDGLVLSDEERIELADFMIDLWRKFKAGP